MDKCIKQKEIETIQKTLNGNGKLGLVALTSNLVDKFDTLTDNMVSMQTDIKVLLRFQTQIEVEKKEKEKKKIEIQEIQQKQSINKRWFIGLAITTIIGLLTIIVTLITIDYNEPVKAQPVSDEEFKELWNNYKKNHNFRGNEPDSTYSMLCLIKENEIS